MAPGERLPKAARKDWNRSLPKFCFAAQLSIKILRTKGNLKMERPLPMPKEELRSSARDGADDGPGYGLVQ